MTRLFFTAIISFFVFVSSGQINANKDSLNVNDPIIKVTLLGTGAPQPVMDRFGPSILVQAGGQSLLFDAGRGCLQRLRQINVAYDKINALTIYSGQVIMGEDLMSFSINDTVSVNSWKKK